MEITRDNAIEIIKQNAIIPSKDKGQNFLVSPTVSKTIVDSLEIENDDCVLEIGPGIGSLTHFLSIRCNDLTVCDIDSDITNYLHSVYPRISIINNDALKIDLRKYNKIISNVPYSVTSSLVEKMLLESNAKEFVIMVQKEVYIRFSSLKGSEYCPLSVLISLLGKIEKIINVSASNFLPAPKCESVAFKITVNNDKEEVVKAYLLAKKLFLNRRKTILNNLTNVTKDKNKAISVLKEACINNNERPENISPKQYLKIVSLL